MSIVVPTHDRVDLVEKLLDSIQRASSKCNASIEIILVDDSVPERRRRIEQLCQRSGAICVRGPPSVREKRNMGVRLARGQIVLFIDSDCEVSENILNEHLKMHERPDSGGVLGITEFVGKENFAWRIVKRTSLLDACYLAKTLSRYLDSAPWTGANNLSVKKKILEEIGGFDTSFPFRLGGDDTDLGIRINKAGYKIRMNPDAIVFHTRETWSSLISIARRAFRWGRMDYYIYYRKHEEKLSPSFIKPTVVFLFLVLVGLLKAFASNFLSGVLLPVFWLAIFLFTSSVLKLASLGESLKELPFEASAQFLTWLFDAGTALESLRSRNLTFIYKTPLGDPRRVIVLWNEKVRETWSLVISIMMILLCLVVI
jgi:GT2 family glycosyltransferase